MEKWIPRCRGRSEQSEGATRADPRLPHWVLGSVGPKTKFPSDSGQGTPRPALAAPGGSGL